VWLCGKIRKKHEWGVLGDSLGKRTISLGGRNSNSKVPGPADTACSVEKSCRWGKGIAGIISIQAMGVQWGLRLFKSIAGQKEEESSLISKGRHRIGIKKAKTQLRYS